jgi:hypothetical protein
LRLIKELKEMIAKMCRAEVVAVTASFDEIKSTVKGTPKDIEELTAIIDKMDQIP